MTGRLMRGALTLLVPLLISCGNDLSVIVVPENQIEQIVATSYDFVERKGKGVGGGVLWTRDPTIATDLIFWNNQDEVARFPLDIEIRGFGFAAAIDGTLAVQIKVLNLDGKQPIHLLGSYDGIKRGATVLYGQSLAKFKNDKDIQIRFLTHRIGIEIDYSDASITVRGSSQEARPWTATISVPNPNHSHFFRDIHSSAGLLAPSLGNPSVSPRALQLSTSHEKK